MRPGLCVTAVFVLLALAERSFGQSTVVPPPLETEGPQPTNVVSSMPIPEVPLVFGTEVEMNLYNGSDRTSKGSMTVAFYEQVDFTRNLTKAVFRVENSRVQSTRDEVVMTDWTTYDSHLIWEGRCRIPRGTQGSRVEMFMLTELLFLARHPDVTYLGPDSVRGIDADVWEVKNLALNKGGITGVVSMKWSFSKPGWKYWGAEYSSRRLLEVSLNGLIYGGWNRTDLHASFNIVDINPSRAWSDDAFNLPVECSKEDQIKANQTMQDDNVTTAAPPIAEINPMPELPSQFSAVVETNMREIGETFTTYEWFSQPKAQAHSTWTLPTMDSYDRQLKHDVFIFGDFQLAYQSTSDAVPKGYRSKFNPQERAMFFPDDYLCSKNVFNKDLIGSTDDVLLKSAAPRARYMGSTLVRGIKAQYWQSANEDYKIQWYFADPNWPYTSSNGTILLRIMIVGKGRPALFVHHPFLQTHSMVPKAMEDACALFMDGRLSYCDKDTVYYHHVHDFISFSDVVFNSDFALPSWCVDDRSSINAVPAAQNCRQGVDNASMIFVVILVAIFTCMVTSIFWSIRNRSNKPKEEEEKKQAAVNNAAAGQRDQNEFDRLE